MSPSKTPKRRQKVAGIRDGGTHSGETGDQARPSPVPRTSEASDADAAGTEATDTGGGVVRRSRIVVAVLMAIAVLMSAAAVTFGVLWGMAEDTESDRAEVLDAAKRYAVSFGTFDYRKLDEHREGIESFATDRFWSGSLKDTVEAAESTLVEGKGTSKATVHRAGIASLEDGEAVVVLIHDQEITNVNVPKPRIDRNRMVMTLKDVDGTWKMDGLRLE